MATPFQTLYLLPNAPPEVVKASYKALAKIYHPDARGNSEKMIAINRAFEIITQNK
jgi:DnaJ-class molecular chaperone